MVMIKTYFSDWHAVKEEQALKWAQHIYNGITTNCDKMGFINSHLQGIQFTENEIKQATRK